MGNKVVAAACAFLARNPNLTSFDDFLAGFANIPRKAPPPCVEREIENICNREFARRIKAAGPKEIIPMEGGGQMEIIRKDRSKPSPLTQFVHVGRDRMPRYYRLRTTKGWRREIIEPGDVKEYAKQGVKVIPALPKTLAFRRFGRVA